MLTSGTPLKTLYLLQYPLLNFQLLYSNTLLIQLFIDDAKEFSRLTPPPPLFSPTACIHIVLLLGDTYCT